MCSLECSCFFVFFIFSNMYVKTYICMVGRQVTVSLWSSEASRRLFLLLVVVSSAQQHSSVMSWIVPAYKPPRDPSLLTWWAHRVAASKAFFVVLFLSFSLSLLSQKPRLPRTSWRFTYFLRLGNAPESCGHCRARKQALKECEILCFCVYLFIFFNDFRF